MQRIWLAVVSKSNMRMETQQGALNKAYLDFEFLISVQNRWTRLLAKISFARVVIPTRRRRGM